MSAHQTFEIGQIVKRNPTMWRKAEWHKQPFKVISRNGPKYYVQPVDKRGEPLKEMNSFTEQLEPARPIPYLAFELVEA